jgi:hypothetical protein
MPYVSFKIFEEALYRLTSQKLPADLGKIKLPISPASKSQLLSALHFLELIDDQDRPTERLFTLVGSFDTPSYAGRLREVLQTSYSDCADLDLTSATPGLLAERIGRHCQSPDSARKALRFYLRAMQKAEVPIGPRLSYGRRSPVALEPRKQRRKSGPESAFLLRELIQKVPAFDERWPEKVQVTWLRAVGKLADRL